MFAAVADQIDVVTVSTPDHMHFPIAVEAIRLGKPVMVQKPLCNNLWEARALANFAKEKGVLHRHGQPRRHHAGHPRPARVDRVRHDRRREGSPLLDQPPDLAAGQGLEFPAETPVPADLNWDVWQGTCATDRPYSPDIHPFKWRGFWDYGCGALGDIGCHSINSAFWVLDLKGDFVVEVQQGFRVR